MPFGYRSEKDKFDRIFKTNFRALKVVAVQQWCLLYVMIHAFLWSFLFNWENRWTIFCKNIEKNKDKVFFYCYCHWYLFILAFFRKFRVTKDLHTWYRICFVAETIWRYFCNYGFGFFLREQFALFQSRIVSIWCLAKYTLLEKLQNQLLDC